VLGSGGVRISAALGLVEVLTQEGLAPDLVVGCSAGALFGAPIAAGHPADDASRLATTLWSAEVTRRRRWRAIPQMIWPRLARFGPDFALRDDRLVRQRLTQAIWWKRAAARRAWRCRPSSRCWLASTACPLPRRGNECRPAFSATSHRPAPGLARKLIAHSRSKTHGR